MGVMFIWAVSIVRCIERGDVIERFMMSLRHIPH